jgi:diguanylate cyclase (GGDEF)-like protein/PAS domain S-box-containing protein
MAPRAWRAFLLASLIVIVVYQLLSPTPLLRMIVYDGFAACCVAAVFVGARRQPPSTRLAWYLLGAGEATFVTGDFIYFAWEPLFHSAAPFPNVGDLFYLACYPLLIAGMVVLIRARTPGRDLASLADATIIATGVAVVAWIFLMQPYADDPTLSLQLRLVLTAYPAMDMLLLAATVRLAVGSGTRPPAFFALAGAAVVLVVTDAFYTLALLAGPFELGGPLDIGWMLFYALIPTASLHPSAPRLSEPTEVPEQRLSHGRLALLAAASLLAPAVEILTAQDSGDVVVGAASGMFFVLVLARTAGVVTALRRSMAQVASVDRRFRSFVQNSTDVIALIDPVGTIEYVSPSAEWVVGARPDELVGTNISELIHPDDLDGARRRVEEVLAAGGGLARIELRVRDAGGAWRWVEGSANNLLHDPNVGGIVLNYRDVTERKDLETQLTHQAFHDPLTNLANRALFRDRVEHALAHSSRHGPPLALIVFDLDDFKSVNDSLGHEAGDKVLIEVARRLRSSLRAADTAARLGGDEFALLLESLSQPNEALSVVERIMEAMRDPIEVEGRQLVMHGSAGIAMATSGEQDTDQLLQNADVAMYRAKGRGRGGYETYEESMHAAIRERLELKADLQRAIENDEFVLHYQPIVQLATGRIVGVEALVRWQHSRRGLIPPAAFVPLAEDTGLIVPIGRWVLKETCHQVRSWQIRYPSEPPLAAAVNLSARQFEDGCVVEDVRNALRESGLAPNDLSLEITESLLMEDTEVTSKRLGDLKQIGVALAIDDFGTGYSSLAYLRRFPIDRLKIDKAFVDGVTVGPEESALARAVIKLGDSLDLGTVAEGIETIHQLNELVALRCEYGQGYYFSPPVVAEAIDALLGGVDVLTARAAATDMAAAPVDRA